MALKINLSEDRLRSVDPANMLGMTLELPRQIERGLEIGREFARRNSLAKPTELDWVGLGGSAVAGDLLQGFGYEPPYLPLRIRVLRCRKPSTTTRLIASYSGNTVEALQAFSEGPVSQIWFSASSGGKLQDLAQQAGVPHLSLPGGYPPRAAVGFMLGAMPAIFSTLYGISLSEYDAVLPRLTDDANAYRILNADDNPALALAVKLIDRTPVFYAVDGVTMPPVAFRSRAQFAENSKVWSHSADLPELAHNEVESFGHLGQILPPPVVLLLGSHADNSPFKDPRTGLLSLLDGYRLQNIILDPAALWAKDVSKLEAGLRLMMLLDAASVYLAILRATNPLEIPVITKLKNIS